MEAGQQPISQLDPANPNEQPELLEDSGQIGEQFLQLRLYPNIAALLSIQYLAEIVTVNYSSVIPVPDMPAWVSGIYNWRGDILWIIDLGLLLGLPPWQEQPKISDTHSVVILRSPRESGTIPLYVGAIVQKIEDFDFYDPDTIRSPTDSETSSTLQTFLQGVLTDPQSKQLYSILDGAAVLEGLPTSSSQ